DPGGLAHGDAGMQAHGHADVASVSPVNFQTLVSFLMGFGGIGYVVTRLGWGAIFLALPVAVAGGLGTSTLAYRWLRFLKRGEQPLPPTSYTGVTGRLTVGIREGGTGELVYTMNAVHQVCAARSADGSAIPKGQEVIVLRYEKGIAYVEPWEPATTPTE
ncbi:MAG TPA: hypothetical protein VD902_14595, partial [Symbiobacteriaceae bacterium]|nr:hypothetical protein [Symbiobacteriaceae bacterium]